MIKIRYRLADNDRMSRWQQHLLEQQVRLTPAEVKLFESPLLRLDIAHRLVALWSTVMTVEGVLGMRTSDVDPSVEGSETDRLPLPADAAIQKTTRAYLESVRPLRADAREEALFVDGAGGPITLASQLAAVRAAWRRNSSPVCTRPVRRPDALPRELAALIVPLLDRQLQFVVEWTAYAPLDDVLSVTIEQCSNAQRNDSRAVYTDTGGGHVVVPRSLDRRSRDDLHARADLQGADPDETPHDLDAMYFFAERWRGLTRDDFFDACYAAIRRGCYRPPDLPEREA